MGPVPSHTKGFEMQNARGVIAFDFNQHVDKQGACGSKVTDFINAQKVF